MADPTIPLQVIGGQATQQTNPLDTISRFATIQNALNQNQLFQQTFAAKQAIGQLMAGANGLDDAFNRVAQSPYAAFAPEILNSIRSAQLAEVQRAEVSTKMGIDATGNAVKLLAGTISRPDQFNNLATAALSAIDPLARPGTLDFMRSLKTSIEDGAGGDPEKMRANAAAILGPHLSPEIVGMYLGKPTTVEGFGPTGLKTTQGAIQAGPLSPTPGAITAGGNAFTAGMTPGESIATHPGGITPSGQPTMVPGGAIFRGQVPGMPGSMPGATNALGGIAQTPQTQATPQIGVPTALPPGQKTVIEDLATDYGKEGKKTFDAALTGLASLQYMDRTFDELSRGAGWETPGTAANARLGIAKAINTIAQMSGTPADKLPFDVNKVSTWEEMSKESRRAGFQLLHQMFGAQREAQTVFQAASAAVPSVENTPQGGKLIIRSLEQAMQREVDRRNFLTNWLNEHQGNLTGADEAFAQQYKPQLYSQRAISTVQPYEVETPDQAANYLPGTLVKRKADGAVFQVTPQISKYPAISLRAQ